jgi:pyruvate dehydrogenase phosphatase
MTAKYTFRLISDHALGAQTLNVFEPRVQQSLGEILEELKQRKKGESKKPLDDNSATHIIRAALGGTGTLEKQYERLQEILQLPPGVARNYRDDITIIVVHFNQEFLASCTGDRQEPSG